MNRREAIAALAATFAAPTALLEGKPNCAGPSFALIGRTGPITVKMPIDPVASGYSVLSVILAPGATLIHDGKTHFNDTSNPTRIELWRRSAT